jgi:hypothetical protein
MTMVSAKPHRCSGYCMLFLDPRETIETNRAVDRQELDASALGFPPRKLLPASAGLEPQC